MKFFGTRPLKDLRASDIEDFLAHLQSKRGCKPQTGNRYLALLSRVFKESVDRGFASENPIPRVPRAREELRAVPFLTVADIDLLIPHQANDRISQMVARRLQIPIEKTARNIDRRCKPSFA